MPKKAKRKSSYSTPTSKNGKKGKKARKNEKAECALKAELKKATTLGLNNNFDSDQQSKLPSKSNLKPLSQRISSPTKLSEVMSLAADLMCSLPQGIWWRAFENLYGEDDVAVGTRQEWLDILPVYLKMGLATTRTEEDGECKIQICLKWLGYISTINVRSA